ncbi:MAG TPA: response regulator [Bacteroidales bacterium]|nr:response regulator [Bacteroidales bacterium]
MIIEIAGTDRSTRQNLPDWSQYTFLVVEDTMSNKALIETFLSRTGVRLLFAYNGLEAIEAVQSDAKIDLVLMDIRLPDMNGLNATRIIKQIKPELPVLAQTAYAMEADRQACYEAGCDGFIAKPYRINEFISKINSILK